MSNRKNTRRSPRIPCNITMEYEIKGVSPQPGRITNIGTVGALITTQEPVPLGTALVLRFQLPLSNRQARITCTVKWADEETVGVEFAHLSLPEQAEIWKYHARESARTKASGD
ncbi:MAG: PilZ domain-containing protein [Candidatus Methylomirabilales bacterium]